MALAVEFAVGSPGSCPVAKSSEDSGEPISGVSRASIGGEGPITEEFQLPADAVVKPSGDSAEEPTSVASTGSETIYRFERDQDEPCVCEMIERIAGPASEVRAADGTLVVTVHVETLDSVRTVVERLRGTFDDVSVRRLTNLEECEDERSCLPAGDLTDRQREVVSTAYEMGYFEYPKGANAGDVSAALDISRSTFAEHLAAATGKLFESVLDPESQATPAATRS